MIDVLEIPVFTSDYEYAKEFFGNKNLTSFDNNGFKYFTFSLNSEKEIIFYIFQVKETIEDTSAFDRLVPKAPYCFLLLKGETFKINNFCEAYKDRFSNPIICLLPLKKNDFDLTYLKHNVLKQKENHLIEYNSSDEKYLKSILIESFNHLMKNQK